MNETEKGPPSAEPSSASCMIRMDDVSKWYGDFQVLVNCTTKVDKAEVVVICGPSGSGKSTLIKGINGLEPFQEGVVTFDGTSVGDAATNLPMLRSRIGMVFQSFELFPHITITDNINLAQLKVLGRDKNEATNRSMALLERVGLDGRQDTRADALSVPAHLAETLLARRVEAHRRAGDADTARALAAAYLQAHPEGRYADRVRASAGDL